METNPNNGNNTDSNNNPNPQDPNVATLTNNPSQNQIQEISNQNGEVPEISNQQKDNQQQNNQQQNQNIQNNPQINQNEQPPQPLPQMQIPQPQPPPENKVIFTHPMNNYCSEEKIKEIETCPPTSIFQIVRKRFDDVSYKLQDILKKHERYTLFSLYYKLCRSFLINRQYGKDPETFFRSKDPSARLKVSDFDFSDVLNMLNCQLTTDELSLILKSLTQKTNTLYSYDEFLKKVYNIQANDNGQMRQIYQQCSYYFNDYLYSFRHYIQDLKIDYRNAYDRACSKITTLTYDLFKKFLDEMSFKIGHEQEKQYIFAALSDANYFPEHIEIKTTAYILQKTIFNMAELNDMSEEDFIKSGIVSVESLKKNTDWLKNIQNYTEGTKELYKKNYKGFENTFKGIHEKCIRYDISNLTTYFVDCGEDISPEGDIDVEVFKKLLNNIGVSYNVQLDTLITQFKDNKKKPKNVLKLAEFISIYNLFVEDNPENNDAGIKFEEEKLKSTNLAQSQNVEYVFKNAHRRFTQDDIDYISEFCDGVADIIINELNDSVTNFFQKKDKKKCGYLFLKEFKEILEKDLSISLEGTEQEMEDFNTFFDFVTSDKMVQGSDIVIIKNLIHTITYYSGKDGPSQENNNNLSNSKQNNNIDFQEEDNLKPTNAPNINENKPNNQNANIKEDINTNSIKIDNNIDNIDNSNQDINKNKNVITEIINTNINTSSISFDKIISDFAQCLNNNRIRFNNVFPSINLEKVINNQTISEETLKLGFQNAGFDITDQEFSVVMTHFDPINKKTILVEDLKHEIAKYQPKYFNQSYQKIDPQIIESRLNDKNFVSSGAFNRDISKVNLLNGMNKIQSYLNKQKISPENFFCGLFSKKNRNRNQQVTEDMWKIAFIPKDSNKSDLIPYLEAKEINAIYKEMDPRLTNNLLLSQIIDFFNKYMNKNENLINYNDQTSLNETIKKEIQTLFDNFDTDHTDQIVFDDFYKCLKSVDHKATKSDAEKIISEHTNKNYSQIDRNTFNIIMYNYIQKSLVIQKEEKDFIMNLFREADIDKNGFLTRNQIKYLMKNKINCNLTDFELDEILDKVDIQHENEIDIREFIFLLDNINNNPNINNINTINTMSNADENEIIPIMNLNLNLNMHRKMRPKDFISLYTGLPLSFIPSFIREEQQKNNLLPSSCLKPLTKDEIIYEDISPVPMLYYTEKKDIKNQNVFQKLDEYKPFINCKIYFDDYATGVSSPDETLFEAPNSQFKVVGRLLKISLFNNRYKNFFGNAISIDCIYKKEYQDRWYFEDDDSKYNNNIIIRYNKNDVEDISIIFEFVLVIQKKVEQNLYTVETSCGWCELPMHLAQVSRKEKLKIVGGSPFSEGNISENDIRKKRIGFIPKLATLFEGAIRSECPVKIKIFNDLSNDEKKIINYLPSLIVCHAAAMQMISLYRKELGEYILNHKDYLLKSIQDEYDLTNMFCKIADVPDAFRVMNEIWKEIVINGANPSSKRNDEDYLRINFKLFVRKINSVLYAEKFKYNPLDPTELPRGDIKLMQDRDILLNSALRHDQDPKFNKLGYKMEDYSYKPFTMDEINGQKGNTLLEKIEEMITLVN